ncbi:hypothetical protein F5146DRAFT_1002396 [Armillaria mellea]|nr:hypothetical protein F5146DRAFT_1002396 [Armillaria mellea]
MQALVDNLEKSFSELSTKDDKKSVLLSSLENLEGDSQGSLFHLYASPGTPKSSTTVEERTAWKAFEGLIARHGLQDEMFSVTKALCNQSRLAFGTQMPPPLSRLGCANHVVSKSQFCPRDGTLTCSGCFLVRYCSKESWIKEKRPPSFVDGDNVPLTIASGDLRNVVTTINELPESYSGSIRIVLNDHNPMVVCRNLMILSILGIISDVEEAAEHALHLWYSVFQPLSYQTRILPRILQSDSLRQSERDGCSSDTFHYSLRAPLDPAFANTALNNIMNAPARADYRDRYYEAISPSHRVAFERWRSFGLVLPFGAIDSHMAVPNKWLFSDGRLMLNDSANPFEGWNIDEIFKAGKDHGTTEDDLIGCLFFYIKDQLVEFSNRLRRFKIQIYSFDQDARLLQRTLKSNASFPQIFDRIEVSNIVDKNYVGMSVLSDWGTSPEQI